MRKAILAAGLLLVLVVVAAPALGQACYDENGRPTPCYVEPDPIPGPVRGGGPDRCTGGPGGPRCVSCEVDYNIGFKCWTSYQTAKCWCDPTYYFDQNGELHGATCADGGNCVYM